MHLVPVLATLLLLSFSSPSSATDRSNEHLVRIPLGRMRDASHDPAARTTSAIKSQLACLARKYRATLAAYESNAGSPHPLAEAISAITRGVWAPAATVEIELSNKKLEKRRRRKGPSGPTSPSEVSRSLHNRDVSLSEVNGNMWMGTISVGTPEQNFSVLFDTGSSDLILPNQTCGTSCDGHIHYDPAASSTSTNLNKTFEVAYSSGSNVNGVEYMDNVYMGGYEATNQTLGAATTYSSGLQVPTFLPDGLLGMGFSMISILKASPVFQTMLSNGVMNQGVFGVALSSQSGKSELTVGGTNTNMYQESTVEYVQVSLPAYWQIPFAGLSRPGLNNTPEVVVVNKTSYAQAIVDTGTTLIITSDSNAQAFYANVPGAKPSAEIGGGAWSVPCNTINLISPTLTFGSRNFTIPPSVFSLGPVSGDSTDCIAGLAGGGSAYWILGDVFLQSVYTIFDVTNTRIGFADLA